jgi:hypothetical protein
VVVQVEKTQLIAPLGLPVAVVEPLADRQTVQYLMRMQTQAAAVAAVIIMETPVILQGQMAAPAYLFCVI